MSNKQNFQKIVESEVPNTMDAIKARIKNRAMLQESKKIALKILFKLEELGWSKKDLAQKLNISPQQVSKIVSGKENLTIETQIKLQQALDIPILASYYEDQKSIKIDFVYSMKQAVENFQDPIFFMETNYKGSKALIGETKSLRHYEQELTA